MPCAGLGLAGFLVVDSPSLVRTFPPLYPSSPGSSIIFVIRLLPGARDLVVEVTSFRMPLWPLLVCPIPCLVLGLRWVCVSGLFEITSSHLDFCKHSQSGL